MLRTAQSLPLQGLSTLGFDAGRFPPTPPALLPGLLAATRTGLPPASDDELTTRDQLHRPPPVCWAREISRLVAQSRYLISYIEDCIIWSRELTGRASADAHGVRLARCLDFPSRR